MVSIIGFAVPVIAQLYWDTNGRTGGASSGNTAPGTWGLDNFWSTSPNGNQSTGAWIPGQLAVFSAGNNATGSFTVNVYGTQSTSGLLFEEGSLTLSGGTLNLVNGIGNATISVASTNFTTIASSLTGNSGLIKSGSGTLLLSGDNSYSGTTSVREGTLLIAKPTSLGSSSLQLDGGAFGAFASPVAINNPLIIAEHSTITGNQNLTFNGDAGAQGGDRTLTINNSALTSFDGPFLTLGDKNKQGRLTFNVQGGDVSISSVIQSGLGARPDGLTKTGPGTLILSGNNTFTGPLQLDQGTLVLASDTAAGLGTLQLANDVTLAASGSRIINNVLAPIGNVTFAGPGNFTFTSSFNLSADTTFTVLNTTTFAAPISGNHASLTKAGSGTLILAANNSFGGKGDSLSLNEGTLALGNNGAVGNNNNVLRLNGGALQAFANPITLPNSVVLVNNSTISGSLGLTLTGPLSNEGGNHTLSILNSALTTFADSSLALANNNSPASLTLNVAASGPGLLISSTIINGSSTGSLIKSGSGLLTLTGNNSYSGGTVVNAGTLLANNSSGSATGSGSVTVNNGATLGGNGSIAGPVILNNGATLAPGNPSSVGSLSTGSQTWNAGARLSLDIQDALAGPGAGYDFLSIVGSLSIRATSANPILIDLRSLDLAGNPGPLYNFSPDTSYSWTLFSASGGITFNPGQSVDTAFSLSTANFQNDIGAGYFTLLLANGGRDLLLSFTSVPIPEPAPWSMIGLGFFLLWARRRFDSTSDSRS